MNDKETEREEDYYCILSFAYLLYTVCVICRPIGLLYVLYIYIRIRIVFIQHISMW